MQSELKEDVSGINRVRSRAGLEPIGTYSLAALQNERRWELCFEVLAGTIFAVGILLPMPLKDRRSKGLYTWNGAESRNGAERWLCRTL